MKVPVFMLADAAAVENGLLNAHHAGWENYTCNAFPWGISGAMCGLVELGPLDRHGPKTINAMIRDHNGAPLGWQASLLLMPTAGDGPARAPFSLVFAFVAQEPTIAEFVLTDEAGNELAVLPLPIRGQASNL